MENPSIETLVVEQIRCAAQVRERFDEESIAGLAQTLAEVGLQQPIRVRRAGRGWEVIDGERRLRAARKLGWKEIPAIIERAELNGADILQRQLVANCQREDLSPIERARAIERLITSAKWTAASAARKLGVSQASVSKLLALLVLPPEVQARIHAGELAASTAYEIAKVRESAARAELVEEAAQGTLTRDQAASRAQGRSGAKPGPRPPRVPRPRLTRVGIPLGEHRSLTISAPALSLPAVVDWLEGLLSRLRPLAASGLELAEAKRALAEPKADSQPSAEAREEEDA